MKWPVSVDDGYYDRRYDYASTNLVYIGYHVNHKAPTTSTNWVIMKYTYGTDGITRIEGPLQGSWDGRAALAWA